MGRHVSPFRGKIKVASKTNRFHLGYSQSMGVCPVCKGSERREIAPGYWSCACIVPYEVMESLPTPGTPPGLGIHSLQPVLKYRMCGTEYQDGGGADGRRPDICSCGTFAVGVCVECSTPVCGMHSEMIGGRRLCLKHLRDEETRLREDSVRVAKAQADEHAAAVAAGLLSATDLSEIARILVSGPTRRPGPLSEREQDSIWRSAVEEVWDRIKSSGALREPTHDIVEFTVSGRNNRLKLQEVSREPAWCLEHLAERDSESPKGPVYIWLTKGLRIWASFATQSAWEPIYGFDRDMKGRVIGTPTIAVAIPTGDALRMRTRGKYYRREATLASAVTVWHPWKHKLTLPGPNSGREAAIAALIQ